MKKHCGDFLKKFKVKTENQGDKFIVTLSGSKEDVAKLEKKVEAMKVLHADCCDCCECC